MFNFVIDCTDASLETYKNLEEEAWVRVFTRGDLNWCLQTYLILAKRDKLAVQCSNKLLPGCINIVHSDQLLRLKGNADTFLVCVQADYPGRRWAHYHLVQNRQQLYSTASYIPHWVQPGLIPRQATRKGVQRVAYAGAPVKGNMAGTVAGWQQLFEPHGIEFVLLPSGCWHDLSTIDILLGVRSFSTQPFHTKPPTKLFSAWHANIPFIGGSDSAFLQVGKPGEDYLQAQSPQEVLKAVLRLKQEPELYARLVQNGQRNARQFTTQAIAETWENTLTGPVTRRFIQWRSSAYYERLRFRYFLELGVFEHTAKQQVKQLLKRYKSLALPPSPVPSER